jgi:hypothetical protein
MTIRTAVLRTILSTSVSMGLLSAAPGLSITSPADGSAVTPGQSLAVTVSATGSFTEVVVVGEGPIGFSKAQTGPTFQFTLPIPARLSPGRYSVTALGASGGGMVNSPPITISVERADAPVQFDVTPSSLNLPVGEHMPLRVVGTYADGTKLDTTHSASTTYSSDSPGVVTVDGQGSVTAVGPGSGHILVNSSLSIPVVVPQTFSVAPIFPVVYGGQSAQFSAFRPGMANVAVNWTISPQVGSISPAGVYTAPQAITRQQAISIIATMKSDPTKTVRTGVALFPPVSLTVSPSGPVQLNAGQTMRFAQTVLNALDMEVDWSISPKNAGSIDNTGLYTAPATIKSAQTVTVIATSIADQSKTATATISLVP